MNKKTKTKKQTRVVGNADAKQHTTYLHLDSGLGGSNAGDNKKNDTIENQSEL